MVRSILYSIAVFFLSAGLSQASDWRFVSATTDSATVVDLASAAQGGQQGPIKSVWVAMIMAGLTSEGGDYVLARQQYNCDTRQYQLERGAVYTLEGRQVMVVASQPLQDVIDGTVASVVLRWICHGEAPPHDMVSYSAASVTLIAKAYREALLGN